MNVAPITGMPAKRHMVVSDCRPERPFAAVADIFGRLEPLIHLLSVAEELLTSGKIEDLVFLGNLTGRSDDSLTTLETIIDFRNRHPGKIHLLAGSQEVLMLTALHHPDSATAAEALKAWASASADPLLELNPLRAHEFRMALHAAELPPAAWKSHYRNGNVLCVHSGVPSNTDPTTLETFLNLPVLTNDFPRTTPGETYHWAWLQQNFLSSPNPVHGSYVVHGHTPWDYCAGVPRAGRMNLDHGCVVTGKLALGVFTPTSITLQPFTPYG